MAFVSLKEFLARTGLASDSQFEEWTKAWRVATESGSQEPLLAFICRERGLAEDVFLQSLAKELGWPFLDLAKATVPNEARNKISTRLLALLSGMHVEIETNGTIAPPPALDVLVHQYNVSPKLAHSGNPAELALIPQRLAAFAADPRAFFKFVIATPADIAEVLALADTYAIPRERLFVMPEGTASTTLQTRARWLAPLALEHGLRFSDRLHIHLYGDTRGT